MSISPLGPKKKQKITLIFFSTTQNCLYKFKKKNLKKKLKKRRRKRTKNKNEKITEI
jgi:replicative superfamily II helicase